MPQSKEDTRLLRNSGLGPKPGQVREVGGAAWVLTAPTPPDRLLGHRDRNSKVKEVRSSCPSPEDGTEP